MNYLMLDKDDSTKSYGKSSKKELLKYNLFDTTQKVPLFSEVIKLVNGRVPILIETKFHNRYGVLEKILINELSNYKGLYAIQSFYPLRTHHKDVSKIVILFFIIKIYIY